LQYENQNKFNKILAVSIGGLGDTILFSPLLKALHKSYSRAHIELLVANRLAKEAYSYAKEVSHVTFANFNHSSPVLKAASLLPFVFKAHLNGKFDIGFFATGLNPKLRHLIKAAGVVRDVSCAPYVPNCPTDLDCNLELARSVDNSIGAQDIFLPKTEFAELEARNILKNHNLSFTDKSLLAVYPSIELVHRPRWELSKLIKVIQYIKNNGFEGKIVVVGSQTEGKEWDAIDHENIVDANLAGKLSILASASLLSNCTLTIGNDGGLMHVAGAVGCPLVSIMPNTPLSYKPPGKNVKIIQSKHTCCNGLYPNRPKNCKTSKCTEDISVNEVFQACQEILDKM
jgi:ADP-heptose:LPS heptosyltransferase